MINNKLKNCCNDCVHCDIVTETKRRAIPDNKTEVVLVNIKCSHMCVCSKYQKEVQDARIHYMTEGLCTALRIMARD